MVNNSKIIDIRRKLVKGFYDVDYSGMDVNSNSDTISDSLDAKLKADILDAFGLTRNPKADVIYDIACKLNNDDYFRDSLVNVMDTLRPLF